MAASLLHLEDGAGAEATARRLVELAPFGIARTTLDGIVLEANRALIEILGFACATEIVGRNSADLVYRVPAERDRIADALRGEGRVGPVELEWRRKDGAPITVRVSARLAKGPGGREEIVSFVEDVTPLRITEEALRQAEKLAAVGQLVSGVAHELNNPLSAIMLFADNLLQDERSPADHEALTMIREQAQRSRTIVRDLLRFVRSRPEPRERVSVHEPVERALRALRPQAERMGTVLELAAPGCAHIIEVGRAGFEQVVTNLVVNAVQAAGRGGTVRVRTGGDAERCRLVVEDDGPGIATDALPRLFEPFFTTKPPGEGTGLGLSVSLGIIQQYDGTIAAENRTAPERGARFTVSLPAAGGGGVAPGGEPAGDGARAAEPDDARPRVLIIDDELTIRAALRRFFSRRGWAVDEAEDGRRGLEMLRASGGSASRYAVVLSDLKMPGLTGIELHDRLQAEWPSLLERLIISTGDVASPEAAAFVQRTRCPVLQKPFELSQLHDMVERLRAH